MKKRGGAVTTGSRKRAASEAAAHVTYEEISKLFGLSLAQAAARIGVRPLPPTHPFHPFSPFSPFALLFLWGWCGRRRLERIRSKAYHQLRTPSCGARFRSRKMTMPSSVDPGTSEAATSQRP